MGQEKKKNRSLDTASPWLARNRNDDEKEPQMRVTDSENKICKSPWLFCTPLKTKTPFSSRKRGSVGSRCHTHDYTHLESGCKRDHGTSCHTPSKGRITCNQHRRCCRECDPECESSAGVTSDSQTIASCLTNSVGKRTRDYGLRDCSGSEEY